MLVHALTRHNDTQQITRDLGVIHIHGRGAAYRCGRFGKGSKARTRMRDRLTIDSTREHDDLGTPKCCVCPTHTCGYEQACAAMQSFHAMCGA